MISQTQLINGSWTASFYGFDGHGSVRFLTDTSGAITGTYTFDSFGNLLTSTGITPNNYLYAGEQLDPNLGFYYLRARYMSPSSGRFWTLDEFEAESNDPLGLHKYLYAESNPINRVDPTGNFSIIEIGIAAFIRLELIQFEVEQGDNILSLLRDDVGITLSGITFGAADQPEGVTLAGLGRAFSTSLRVIAKSARRARALVKVARALRSNDPHDLLGGQVGKRYRHVLVNFERKIKGPLGEELTDFDVELENAVIEVTAGLQGSSKPAQLAKRVIPNTQKPVIFFGPNITKGPAYFREIEKRQVPM